MKHLALTVSVIVLLACSTIVLAESGVVVRTKAEPASPWVGQKVTLLIDVLAKDGWATIDTLPLIEVPGAYLHRYESQGTRLSENIEGASYTGQRYEFLLFAQTAGELTIDTFPVEVSVKTWGADAATKVEQHSTELVLLNVQIPEGVSPSQYLPATKNLEATQSWSTESKKYQAGDVVERTITREADDVSAMVFPPFAPVNIDGMTCYPDQPEVNDNFGRGVLTGTRVDRLSCIFEKQGEFILPDIEVAYWKVTDEKIETIVLAGGKFTVEGGGQEYRADDQVVETKPANQFYWYLMICTVVPCTLLFYFRRRLSAFIQKRREVRHNSERFMFARVEVAAKGGNKEKMLSAVMCWLDRLPGLSRPARLGEFVGKTGDEKLCLLLVKLEHKESWSVEDCQTFQRKLQKGRKSYLHANTKEADKKTDLSPVGLGL